MSLISNFFNVVITYPIFNVSCCCITFLVILDFQSLS